MSGVAVGLVHPGSMGSAVGACAAASVSVRCVHWASAGRSTATIERAEADGLVDVGTLQELARRCDIVISVCPPDKAVSTAADVMAAGFSGLCVWEMPLVLASRKMTSSRCHFLDQQLQCHQQPA